MKHLFLVFVLVSGLVPPAQADELEAMTQLAETGDSKAWFYLGTLYRDGRDVARDFDEMLHWWRLAAAAGDLDAQFALADMYSGGYGFDRDLVLAYMWYDILAARAQGEYLGEIAVSNRNALTPAMTAADIEMASKLSADWQSQHAE